MEIQELRSTNKASAFAEFFWKEKEKSRSKLEGQLRSTGHFFKMADICIPTGKIQQRGPHKNMRQERKGRSAEAPSLGRRKGMGYWCPSWGQGLT